MSGTFEYVGMLTVVMIGGQNLSFVGLWVMVKFGVMVSPWVVVVGLLFLVSCVGGKVHSV